MSSRMPYPEMPQRPQGPNIYSLMGRGAQSLGGEMREFAGEMDERAKMKAAMEEMVERRRASIEAQRISALEEARAQQEHEIKMQDRKRMLDAIAKIAPQGAGGAPQAPAAPAGMPSPQELSELEIDPQQPAAGGYTAPTQHVGGWATSPFDAGQPQQQPRALTREQQAYTLLEGGALNGPQYLDATDPAKSPDFLLRKMAVDAGYDLQKAVDREEFMYKLQMLRDGNAENRARIMAGAKENQAAKVDFTQGMGNELTQAYRGAEMLNGIASAFRNHDMASLEAVGASIMSKVPIVGTRVAPESSKYDAARRQTAEVFLRIATGAAAPDPEKVDYLVNFLPVAGDPPEIAQNKMDEFRSRVMAEVEGRAFALQSEGEAYLAVPGMEAKGQNYIAAGKALRGAIEKAFQGVGRIIVPRPQSGAGGGRKPPQGAPRGSGRPPAAPPPMRSAPSDTIEVIRDPITGKLRRK